jgi:hypothetical protein
MRLRSFLQPEFGSPEFGCFRSCEGTREASTGGAFWRNEPKLQMGHRCGAGRAGHGPPAPRALLFPC